MSLLYFIISCEDLRPPLYSRFRHALFSFIVVDIMYSSHFALFHTWEGSGLVLCNRRLELSLIVLSFYYCALIDRECGPYAKIFVVTSCRTDRTK